MEDTRLWLHRLSPVLARQRRLLETLLHWCELDGDARRLVVGCSLARGTADALSDLDVAMGVEDGRVEPVVQRVGAALCGFGDVIEYFDHEMPKVASTHRRLFAQFADRCQIDLVVGEQSYSSTVPGTIALYDPAGVVVTNWSAPPEASSVRVREWACFACEALVNLGKYVARRSPWEAHDRLEAARNDVWRLWAAAEGIASPEYGVTSVLDSSEPARFPEGIEGSVEGLDLAALLEAGICTAQLLGTMMTRLFEAGHRHLPTRFARFVLDDLEARRIGLA